MSAKVTLNSLTPEDVEVQVLTGLVDAEGNLKDPIVTPMRPSERDAAGSYLFQTVVQPSARSGLHGYAIRLLPKHADSISPFLPGLIKWAQASSPVRGIASPLVSSSRPAKLASMSKQFITA